MNIPKSWGEITIAKYEELVTIPFLELNPIEQKIRVLSVLTENPQWVNGLPYPAGLNEQYEKTLFLHNIEGLPFVNDFTIDGVTYIVNPGINHMTAGQITHFMDLIKDKDKIQYNYHKLMAIMCLPKGGKHDVEGFNKRQQLFHEKLTMDVVLPVSAFFLQLFLNFLKAIPDYLTQELATFLQTTPTEIKKLLKQDGGGS